MIVQGKGLGRGFSPGFLIGVKRKKTESRLSALRSQSFTKNPKYDLRAQYSRVMQLAIVGSLSVTILAMHGARSLNFASPKVEQPDLYIEVAEIPPTEQIKRPPPPERPAVPIPSESEDIPDDATIESTELALSDLPPPPPPPTNDGDDPEIFVAYDEPPEIIGGYAALVAALEYPELARKAGIEGLVVVSAVIDENGKILSAEIAKGLGDKAGFEKAAIKAIKSVKWKPAYQRDRPIKVRFAIPVRFRLT